MIRDDAPTPETPVRDETHGRIIKALAKIVLLHDDDNGRIPRDPVMQEVQHIRADADALERSRDSLRAQLDEVSEVADSAAVAIETANGMAEEIEKLERELAEARRDAARYRWLRDRTKGQRDYSTAVAKFDLPHIKPLGNIMQGSMAGHLDAAIDAALPAAPDSAASGQQDGTEGKA